MALALTPTEILGKGEHCLLTAGPHWERVPLSYVADVQNGAAFKSEYFTHGDGLPLIRIRDVGKTETDNHYNGPYGDDYLVYPGDIIIGMDGDFRAAKWEGDVGLLNQRVCRLKMKSRDIDHDFLFYCLQPFLDAINAETSSVTVKHLSSRTLAEIPLPLPPFNEQRRIVAKIEELFSELDKGVESLKTARAQLKTYRQSLLKAAFEGRLTEQWRHSAKKSDTLTPVAESLASIPEIPRPNRWNTRSRDVIYAHPCLAVGDPETPLPKSWEWVPLVDVARMESGHTPSRRRPEWWGGDIPWIGISDARANNGKVISETTQYTNVEGLQNSAARLLPEGTVCVSRTASVGYVVEMGCEMATSQDFVNWVPSDAVTSAWLRLVFGAHKEYLLRFSKGTTHRTIYFPEWLSVHIGLPSVEEQNQIVEEVEANLSQMDALESVMGQSLNQSEVLRQSILKRAFEGKLVSQDPDDEPASVLLERIRQEQADDAPGSKRGKRDARATA